MFRKLHIQLTTFCTVVTGLILAILTVICLFISESGMRQQEYDSFLTNLNTMYQNLAGQSALSHNWIRQTEYNYQMVLRITDNGAPLFFEELSKEQEYEALLDQITETAASEYRIDVRETDSTGKLSQHEEFTFHASHGESVYASAALIPHGGGLLGVSVFHPLTELNKRIRFQRTAFLLTDLAALILLMIFFWYFTARMIRPLQENKKKQMQFVASASHELRSPLTVILSNVAAVKSGIMKGDSQFLDTVESEGTRMARLISDMLQLAGADNHSWSINPSDVEMDTLLLQVWENYEPLAAAKHLQWDIRLPDEPVPHCTCDAERIRQLLSVLIDNAFSYTPAGGRVCLALECTYGRRENTTVSIFVSDNGPGIPDSQKNAVFERFYRADVSRKDKSHFGLGLCIAQEIVRLHKGQLKISDTPGGGATFSILLPVHAQ